jgi:hypothetical protein
MATCSTPNRSEYDSFEVLTVILEIYLLLLLLLLLLTKNGFIPSGSGTAISTTHKITYNTQNKTQHTKLQK